MNIKNLLLMALMAVCMQGLGSCGATDDTASRISSEVRSVDKLVLSQMAVSKMASISDIDFSNAEGLKQSVEAVLDAVKIGDRKAAYSYDTYMRAFIDLSSFSEEDIEIDKQAGTMIITLPAVQTEIAGRDAELREDHYRVSGMRSEINAEERARIKEKMNTALKREVENDDTFRRTLTETAKNRGRRYFESLAGRYGYKATVNFR